MIYLFIAIISGLAAVLLLKSFNDQPLSKQEPEPPEPASTKETSVTDVAGLYRLADEMEGYYRATAQPKDLLGSEDFLRGVDMLSGPTLNDEDLVQYCTGDNDLIACMALEALSRRSPDEKVIEKIVSHLGRSSIWPIYFALQVLSSKSKGPVVGSVLAEAQDWWSDNSVLVQFVNTFIRSRVSQGEKPAFGDRLKKMDEYQIGDVRDFVKALDKSGIDSLLDELEEHKRTRINVSFLNSVGRIWNGEELEDFVYEHDALLESLDQAEEILFTDPSRSVILVGEPGTGKTLLMRMLAKRLRQKDWLVFEANAVDVLAGQMYIGQLEERVQSLIRNLDKRRRIIWFIQNFHELHYAGRHRYSPNGVLDMLLPFIDNGTLKVIGKTHPAAYERLTRQNRRVHTTFEAIRVHPMDDTEALALAEKWAASQQKSMSGKPFVDNRTLKEAMTLAKQFLSDKAAPGNLLGLLKSTMRHLLIDDGKDASLTVDDLFITLSQLTGLPGSVLDDREGLNLSELRDLFGKRVMGQPEAVDCLVERVAMIKAGLTDPTRPSGVFLFAGPTGTGKTEIAKTLSEFLFGSSERMIRLDMSEFKTHDSMDRIVGNTDDRTDGSALVNLIRKQPFSVVLLDEFEKSHPNIWDLFLQVFDDGRLTDRNGNTADFRHSIIILTSNLGSTIKTGTSIGFNPGTSSFSLSSVEKAIAATFRREFVNRIDRVVVFRPLSRSVMREILYNELAKILERRGLRNREWAVEWEDTAIDFLLEKGFTPDLGARPVKRAIERYLLSPLALTISDHKFPEGDQFLFVRSDGTKIDVQFVDPDAPEAGNETEPEIIDTEESRPEGFRLKSAVLEARGTREEVLSLEQIYKGFHTMVNSGGWRKAKEALLDKTSSPGFWDSPDRYSILGETEYMDRFESGLNTAGFLLNRLIGTQPGVRKTFSQSLVRRLAEQLYLLREAHATLTENIAKDAFLYIETGHASQISSPMAQDFARQLSTMYINWAKKRRMHYRVLGEDGAEGNRPYEFILAVSGFGAYSILRGETGLHTFEVPKSDNTFERLNVRIQVVPQPETPVQEGKTLLDQARDALARKGETSATIVRRYRREPSPLVRDTINKWRTGHLDRVLDGDFDLFI